MCSLMDRVVLVAGWLEHTRDVINTYSATHTMGFRIPLKWHLHDGPQIGDTCCMFAHDKVHG